MNLDRVLTAYILASEIKYRFFVYISKDLKDLQSPLSLVFDRLVRSDRDIIAWVIFFNWIKEFVRQEIKLVCSRKYQRYTDEGDGWPGSYLLRLRQKQRLLSGAEPASAELDQRSRNMWEVRETLQESTSFIKCCLLRMCEGNVLHVTAW